MKCRVSIAVDVHADSPYDAARLVDGLLINHIRVTNVDIGDTTEVDHDPTPWCLQCGDRAACDCGEPARNN